MLFFSIRATIGNLLFNSLLKNSFTPQSIFKPEIDSR